MIAAVSSSDATRSAAPAFASNLAWLELGSRVTATDLVASIEEAARDGAALFTRGSRDDDCELLCHVLVPFFCGQYRDQPRGCNRDWNNPEKAGRTSMKITAHSTATKTAIGSPLGAIKAWKVRMLTITGANTATANGT